MRYVRMPKGGTLYKIAQQEHMPLKAILFTNHTLDPRRIRVGKKIAIPETEDDLLATTAEHPEKIHQKSHKAIGNKPDQQSDKCEISVELLNNLTHNHGPWFMGKRSQSRIFRSEFSTYTDIHNFNKKKFVRILKQKMKKYHIDASCYHKAHFLSQIIYESAYFDTTLEYGSGRHYEPGVNRDAVKNGNTRKGDGRKYRGRGLLQLTWKNNYKAYSKFTGKDFITYPQKVGSVMENAIDVSCWYWRYRGALYRKYGAQGDINVLIDHDKKNVKLVTLAVNGGRNGLHEREKIFEQILSLWKLP